MNFYLPAFTKGLAIGFSLIIAIGAQNAFILKQAILQNHLFTMAITCILIDSVLIILGVNSVGSFLTSNSLFLEIAKWGGGVFLFFYAMKSFYEAFKNKTLQATKAMQMNGSSKVDNNPNIDFPIDIEDKKLSFKEIIVTLLAVTLLNPHSYIDACLLIGSVGACFPHDERASFSMGAILASAIWFFALSYGASLLKPFFEKPITWRILDFVIGCVILIIAISLVRMKI